MTGLAEMRDGLHVSVSQLKTFIRCPRSYELRYVRGVRPAFVPIPLAFGTAIHAALGHWYTELKDGRPAPTLDDLVAVFGDGWETAQSGVVPLQSEDDDAGVDHVARAVGMLAAFRATAMKAEVQVDGIEVPFSIDLHDPDTGEVLQERLVGAFDVVLRQGERKIVLENKTAARRWSPDQLQHDIQISGYKLAAEKLGLGDVGLRFQILSKSKTPAVQIEEVERGEHDIDDLLRTTVGVLRAVDARAFYPLRGPGCRTCPFRAPCTGGRS